MKRTPAPARFRWRCARWTAGRGRRPGLLLFPRGSRGRDPVRRGRRRRLAHLAGTPRTRAHRRQSQPAPFPRQISDGRVVGGRGQISTGLDTRGAMRLASADRDGRSAWLGVVMWFFGVPRREDRSGKPSEPGLPHVCLPAQREHRPHEMKGSRVHLPQHRGQSTAPRAASRWAQQAPARLRLQNGDGSLSSRRSSRQRPAATSATRLSSRSGRCSDGRWLVLALRRGRSMGLRGG